MNDEDRTVPPFHYQQPDGTYKLDLADPVHRAILKMILTCVIYRGGRIDSYTLDGVPADAQGLLQRSTAEPRDPLAILAGWKGVFNDVHFYIEVFLMMCTI